MSPKKIVITLVTLFVLALVAVIWFFTSPASDLASGAVSNSVPNFASSSAPGQPDAAVAHDQNIAFELVDAAERSLDGSPALALTFSQPLNPKESYGQHIRVFEMPGNSKQSVSVPRDYGDYGYDGDDGRTDQVTDVQTAVSTSPEDTDTKDGKEVKGAWVVGENPRLLYFPHIKPQARYVVYVKPEVKAGNEQTLSKEYRYSVVSAAMSPAFYFASNGMVLPAKQSGGLPVVTVNIPEVNVEFLRVRNGQLPRFMNMVVAGIKTPKPSETEDDPDRSYNSRHRNLHGKVDGWELEPLHKMAESVYQNRFVTEEKRNKRSVTFLSVEEIKELKEPGVYVAIMTQPGRYRYDYQVTYFYVSDIGLSLHLYPKNAEALVSSLTDGKAIGGVTVSWRDKQGKILSQAETDGEGRARFDALPDTAKIIVATKGDQISMIALKEPALDLSEFSIGGGTYKATRLFAYSGRDLYRPGERFEASVLARDADGLAVPPQPIQAILRRPDGRNQLVSTWHPDPKFPGYGYYRQKLDLPLDAPTGKWSLELRNDPADKQAGTVYKFSVEEFMPERMKLDLSSGQKALVSDEAFNVAIKGSYLYGAPTAGNRLLGVVEYSRDKNPLEKQWPGFAFGNEDDDKLASRRQLDEQSMDAQGAASASIDTAIAQKLKSPFRVRATFSLLETGGRPVIRSIERTIWPTEEILGIRPTFPGNYAVEGSLAQFEVVRSNSNGELLAVKGAQVRVFRENRSYYWRFDDQRGWNSGYAEAAELVNTFKIDIPASGRGLLKIPVKYGRYRIEVTDPQSPAMASYRFYAGWSAEQNESDGIRPDRVTLSLDKPVYKDGDTAQLTITAPHKGQAIIAVEGDRLLWFKRMAIDTDKQIVSIPLDKNWKRQDIYVSVTVLRPGNEGDLVTPARALGVIHMGLDRNDRKLAVTLEAPDKVKPETTAKISIRVPEAKGQSAMVTVHAVDTGILNITNFVTPDPFQFFFGQLRYNVDIHDIYGRLIEKMAGKKGTVKWGGDTSMKSTKSMPQKVKLVDLFSGPVMLDADGQAQIALPVPDFNGKLRLMAVASTADHFGSADREMTVAAPLIAELATPRFIGLGDSATIALDLHNLSGMDQRLKVNVSGSTGLVLEKGARTVALKDQEKTTLRFTLSASGAPNLGDLRVQVAGQDIKLDRHFPLQVEAPTVPQTVTSLLIIEPGQAVSIKPAAESSGWYPGSETVQLLISDKTPLDIRPVISGLLTYPYGCAEQTTSTSYPHLFIDEDTAQRYGMKPFTREERMAMISRSVAKLGAMQAPNGGFSLWGNPSSYEYWLSAYITQFLQDARANGFEVPDEIYRKAVDYLLKEMSTGIASLPSNAELTAGQKNRNGGWNDVWSGRNRDFGALAYGAYVLAQEKKAPLASLRQLHDARANATSGLSLVQLGIALHLMGDEGRAQSVLAEGVVKARDRDARWYDYGSGLRDTALSYALLQKHKLDISNSGSLVGRTAELLKSHPYLSTQEQLALFLAARGLEAAPGTSWNATLDVANKSEQLTGQGNLFSHVLQADLVAGTKLHNTSKQNLFVQVTSSGYPRKTPEAGGQIKLTRTYFNADGTLMGQRPLKVGDTLWVGITANSTYNATNTMIVDRIPAGLEIENTNLIQGEIGNAIKIKDMTPAMAMSDRRIIHTEFRDDRFVAAVQLGSWWSNQITLFYRVRVVTPGRFIIPPLSAEEMYTPAIRGSLGGGEVMEITSAQDG